MGPRRRGAVLLGTVVAVVVVAGCGVDDGSARTAADVTVSVAYDGHHDATVTVRSRRVLTPRAATFVVRNTATRVLLTREAIAVALVGPRTYRAALHAVGLRGTTKVDAGSVLRDVPRSLALRSDASVWVGVCIPETRAKWSFTPNGSSTDNRGCADWYGQGSAPMYLHLGTYSDGATVPFAVLVVLAAGAIAAYPLYRRYRHGLLIGLLVVAGVAVSLFDAGALAVLRVGPLFAIDPETVFGMDPDASLHRLEGAGAVAGLVLAAGYVAVAIAIAVSAAGDAAREPDIATPAPV